MEFDPGWIETYGGKNKPLSSKQVLMLLTLNSRPCFITIRDILDRVGEDRMQ